MKLTVKPLTPGNWPDLEKVFNARGCAVARGCWCMYYRRSGASPGPTAGMTRAARNRADLAALARADTRAKSMFDDAGFAEVARRKSHRPVVRLRLQRSAGADP